MWVRGFSVDLHACLRLAHSKLRNSEEPMTPSSLPGPATLQGTQSHRTKLLPSYLILIVTLRSPCCFVYQSPN